MNQAEVQQALAAAAQAQAAGRAEEAGRRYRDLIARAGEQPAALNALGIQALARRDFADAAQWFARATAADPNAPDLWMNLAKAHREMGDDAAEAAALDGALANDQLHLMALIRTAELHERRGERARAAERWAGVLAVGAGIEPRTPALDALFERARDYVTRAQDDLAAAVDTALAAPRAGVDPAVRRRFDACVDHALGRRRIYANECAGLHFPFLPADEFFPRALFPWLAQLEAQTAVIRAEFEALVAADAAAITPYVAMPPGTPDNKWSALDHKLDWGALHLWRHGVRDDAVCARVPRTAAAVEALPLAEMPGRTPTIFFSILQPGTRLPAHTGVSNLRAVIHLPLIVPPDCGFRVGGETRQWREGEAWAFDDTIEHEAWNLSGHPRAILILDAWNPYIAEDERALLASFFAAADAAGPAGGAVGRVGGD